MKIIFRQNIPDDINKPFGIYQYDEVAAQNQYYIDIRGIVRENSWNWLDEVQASYSDVSKGFLRYTRLWWLTGMSRLDVRPWWQESLVKPLLYANAVLEWIRLTPDVKEIMLVGCDPMVAAYLKEFDEELILEGKRKVPKYLYIFFQAIKHSVLALIKILMEAYRIGKHHMFKRSVNIEFSTIVLYELVPGLSVTSGYKYFYGSLFDSVKDMETESIGYCCIEYTGSNIKRDRAELTKSNSVFFLFDSMSVSDLAVSILKNIYIILVTSIVAFTKIRCPISGSLSLRFWPNYLFQEMGRVPCLNAICAYTALKSLLKQSPQCKLVVYPYEEKGIERAILFACQKYGIRTIGYTPHPQYRSALSLRDNTNPLQPKPSRYAVCGSAYVDYFTSWGKKNRNLISIWGSEKSHRSNVDMHEINRSHLKILLLLSHPNELKVFYSWLRADSRISHSVAYTCRFYKAASVREFENVFALMMKEFNCIRESKGQLDEDLKQCDMVAFCGTSAGPLSVNRGYLGMYLDLNDFLEINPCFDDLDAMLPCGSAKEFAYRLSEIRGMDDDSLMKMHQRQLSLVERIFSPVQISNIREELLC